MATYVFRKIPEWIWGPFFERAREEGRPLRWLFLYFMRSYSRDGLVVDPALAKEIDEATVSTERQDR